MKKIAILFLILSNCCVQRVVIKTDGVYISPRESTAVDSLYKLQTYLGEQGFGYYSKCPQNDSLIWINLRNKSAIKKMKIKLARPFYFSDGLIPASEIKYSIQDTSIVDIDTIIPSKDSMVLDNGLIKLRIKKDGITTLFGRNEKIELKAKLIIKNKTILATGFPLSKIVHYSQGICNCNLRTN